MLGDPLQREQLRAAQAGAALALARANPKRLDDQAEGVERAAYLGGTARGLLLTSLLNTIAAHRPPQLSALSSQLSAA